MHDLNVSLFSYWFMKYFPKIEKKYFLKRLISFLYYKLEHIKIILYSSIHKNEKRKFLQNQLFILKNSDKNDPKIFFHKY